MGGAAKICTPASGLLFLTGLLPTPLVSLERLLRRQAWAAFCENPSLFGMILLTALFRLILFIEYWVEVLIISCWESSMPRKSRMNSAACKPPLWRRFGTWARQPFNRYSINSAVKKLAYTTVLSALQKLETGWVKHRQQGRTYVFRPKYSRGEEGQRSVRKLLERVFAGDAVDVSAFAG